MRYDITSLNYLRVYAFVPPVPLWTNFATRFLHRLAIVGYSSCPSPCYAHSLYRFSENVVCHVLFFTAFRYPDEVPIQPAYLMTVSAHDQLISVSVFSSFRIETVQCSRDLRIISSLLTWFRHARCFIFRIHRRWNTFSVLRIWAVGFHVSRTDLKCCR